MKFRQYLIMLVIFCSSSLVFGEKYSRVLSVWTQGDEQKSASVIVHHPYQIVSWWGSLNPSSSIEVINSNGRDIYDVAITPYGDDPLPSSVMPAETCLCIYGGHHTRDPPDHGGAALPKRLQTDIYCASYIETQVSPNGYSKPNASKGGNDSINASSDDYFYVGYAEDINTEYIPQISFGGDKGEQGTVHCLSDKNGSVPSISYAYSDTSSNSVPLSYYAVTITDGTTTYASATPTSSTYALIGPSIPHKKQLFARITPVDQWGASGATATSAAFIIDPDDTPSVSINTLASGWNAAFPSGAVANIVVSDGLGLGNIGPGSNYTVTYSRIGDAATATQVAQGPLAIGTNSISFSNAGEGTYYISAVVVSVFGGQASVGPIAVMQYDATAPEVASLASTFISDGSGLTLSWKAADAASGLANCTASCPGIAGGIVVSHTGDSYSATVSTAELYGSTPEFSVTATDSAGNRSSPVLLTVPVPPQINFTASVESYGTGSTIYEQIGQQYMEVDLDFGVSAAALKMLSSLRISRTNSAMTLSDLNIEPSTIDLASISTVSASPGASPWKLDGSNNVVYVDYIPVSTHAGHKAWTYALNAQISSSVSWNAILNPSQAVTLPNNQGTAPLSEATIYDMNGNPKTSPSFAIGATGTVQIGLQGSDPDLDPWSVEIDQVTQITQSGYTFTSYAPISGKAKVSYSDPYPNTLVPITLNYGDNYIQVRWTEGEDSAVVYSKVEDLQFTQSYGAYTLTVLDGFGNQVAGSSSGIVCAPWQPLQFMVSGDDTANIGWDFGDGATAAGASPPTHYYQQQAGQLQSYCTYALTLTLPTSPTATTVSIPVTVQDTQEGELWGDEHWCGPHTVVGEVVVPNGMKLHILTNTDVPTEAVSFQGDLGAGYLQGITVDGNLTVDGGVTFQKAAGQGQGWGRILVRGNATIGSLSGLGVLIEDADRGVAVDQGGAAAIANTSFAGNATGLQVVGSNAVSVDTCIFSGNRVYGIKEDAGGRPSVVNSVFRGNRRSYYQFDGGVIGIDALNALNKPNNSGNSGE